MREMVTLPILPEPPGDTLAETRALTVRIVAAYVSRNIIAASDLAELIDRVHKALAGFGTQAPETASEPVPAVPVRKSVTPDYLVCLEDGLKMKLLKRHLSTVYGMTPEQYRARWRLPSDYPMIAPNYAARRSELAKTIRLGHRDRTET